MLPFSTDLVTHRTGITAADSGNDPSAWADTPGAISLAGSKSIRIYPVVTGTNVVYTLRIVTKKGSNFFVSSPISSGSNPSEIITFTEDAYLGESACYIKIDTLTGTNPNVTLQVCGVSD